MISQIFDLDCFKILSVFGLAPGVRLRRQELQQKTKLHNVPLDNGLAKLISAAILKKEKKLFALNFESPHAKQVLGLVSQQHKFLREIPLDAYFLILDLIYQLSTAKAIELWLFGSYAKLIYKATSDVDIALLAPKGFTRKFVDGAIQKLEKKYGKNIELHIFDRVRFYKSKRDPLVRDILRNGIRLV